MSASLSLPMFNTLIRLEKKPTAATAAVLSDSLFPGFDEAVVVGHGQQALQQRLAGRVGVHGAQEVAPVRPR